MRKIHYLGAAISVCIISGILSTYLFSGLGFSLARVLDPSFLAEALHESAFTIALAFTLMGVSLGSIFSASRFLGKFQSVGFCAMSGLIITLVGSVFFWGQIGSYTMVALGLFLGMAFAGFFASGARGSRYSIGADHAKKAFTVLAAVVFIGSFLMVSSDAGYYRERFTESITGLTSMSADEIDDPTLERMIRDANPKPSFEEYVTQIPGYAGYTEEQRAGAERYYREEFDQDYERSIQEAVALTRERLEKSGGASTEIMQSMGFFKMLLDNLALVYAFTLASMLLLAQMVIVAPAAGATSWAFQKPLPEEAQPLPKGDVLRVRWTGE